jgi:hypothetical protein
LVSGKEERLHLMINPESADIDSFRIGVFKPNRVNKRQIEVIRV